MVILQALTNYFNEWIYYYNYIKDLNDKLLESYIVNIEEDMLKSKEAYYYEYSIIFISYSYYLEKTINICSENYLESIINKHKYRRK